MNGFTLPKECKIEGVAARDNGRYTICGVQINAERKSLLATDGRILLELPVPAMNGETTAIVPTGTFKALRRGRKSDIPFRVHCDGEAAIVSGSANHECVNQQFPVIHGSFPDAPSILDGAPDADVVVGIDAALLARLAAGLGTSTVVLRIRTTDPRSLKGVESVISVTPITSERYPAPVPNARGAIMPINVH